MAFSASPTKLGDDASLRTWLEAIEARNLRDLPFKVELNRVGNVLLTQRRVSQGRYQAQIRFVLNQRLPDGRVIIDAGIETSDNVKVADVAWLASAHCQKAKQEAACSTAPAICVEVTSKAAGQVQASPMRPDFPSTV